MDPEVEGGLVQQPLNFLPVGRPLLLLLLLFLQLLLLLRFGLLLLTLLVLLRLLLLLLLQFGLTLLLSYELDRALPALPLLSLAFLGANAIPLSERIRGSVGSPEGD